MKVIEKDQIKVKVKKKVRRRRKGRSGNRQKAPGSKSQVRSRMRIGEREVKFLTRSREELSLKWMRNAQKAIPEHQG